MDHHQSEPIWLLSFRRVCQQSYPLRALITDDCLVAWHKSGEREKETANGPLGYFVCLTMNPLPFADINKHQTAKVDE